jgi:hypothetical protein
MFIYVIFDVFSTVTVHEAFNPFTVVAVIVAVPGATAVTVPVSLTIATFLSDVVHVMLLLAAFVGVTVAVIVIVSLTGSVRDVRLSETDRGSVTLEPESGV